MRMEINVAAVVVYYFFLDFINVWLIVFLKFILRFSGVLLALKFIEYSARKATDSLFQNKLTISNFL